MVANGTNRKLPLFLHPRRRLNHEAEEILLSLAAVLIIAVTGTVGYHVLEGWRWLDSLYMTVITLSTIGFQEVHPLSPQGRIFTMLLVVLGVGTAAVLFTTIARKVIQGQMLQILGRRRIMQAIKALEGHTIMCGYGRLTRSAAKELRNSKLSLVIVDQDDQRLEEAQEAGFMAVRGDATREETLLNAGVQRAAQLVTALPKDADNLYIILTARDLNPKLQIISRAQDEYGEKRLRQAGADKIIAPHRMGGQKIASGLLRPFVNDFLDIATAGKGLAIEELRIQAGSPLAGKSLREAALRKQTNIIIAAIIPPNGEMTFNPSGETLIEAGSILIGLGQKKDFAALERFLA